MDPAEAAKICLTLARCGNDDAWQRISVADDGFESHNDARSSTESDVGNLAKGFAKRIDFGLKLSILLEATTHWAPMHQQGCDACRHQWRCPEQESKRQDRERQLSASTMQANKGADHGKLKKHQGWIVWSTSLRDQRTSPQAEAVLERFFFSDFSRAATLHDPAQDDDPLKSNHGGHFRLWKRQDF
jgi:hypothetical protein